MNRTIKYLVAITFLSMSGLAFAGPMSASSHDLTVVDIGGLGTTADLCRYCHTPHNSRSVAPLWDRSDSLATFIPYASGGTMEGTPAVAGVSLGCLSCHDGVTAFDAVAGTTGTVGNNLNVTDFPGTTAIVGIDLTNDHPIGMSITAAGITAGQSVFPIFGGNVECASCHDVHLPGTAGYFLRVEDGTMCETCHTK